MRRVNSTIRRSAAVIAVSVAMLAVTGTGAQAVGGLPAILNGKADSQALQIKLTLPSTDSLNAALSKLGLEPAAVLPAGLLGQEFVQTIALNSGEVLRAAELTDHAAGFAAPLQGLLGGSDKVTSRCGGDGCAKTKALSGTTINVLEEVFPGGIGTISIAGAESATKSMVDTRNSSGLAHVDLNLAPLFAVEALAPVAAALRGLTDTVNTSVLPAVNPVLEDVGLTLKDLIADTPLEGAVKVGPVNPLPDLTKVSLLNLDILKSFANVRPKTVDGVEGLLAESHAKVANLDILGTGSEAWAHIGAVGLTTESFANGVAGQATGTVDQQVVGANLGGALGLDIKPQTVIDLTNGGALVGLIEKHAAELGLPEADELLAAVDLLYNIAGIDVKILPVSQKADPKGNWASASAGTLQITIEPKIPTLAALQDPANRPDGAIVPRLSSSDFVSTGLVLQVSLPNASSAVAVGDVLGDDFKPPGRSGVATPMMAAFLMIAAAIVTRRFALSK